MFEYERGYIELVDGSKEIFFKGIKVLSGYEKRDDIKAVYVPNSVVVIDDRAFYGCKNLTAVYVDGEESKLRFIGHEAFYMSEKLHTFTIPKALQYIGDWAFCMAMFTEVDLSGTKVNYVGRCAFMHNHILKSVLLPCTVTSISENCFSCCAGLGCVQSKGKISAIESGAFDGCSNLVEVPKLVIGAKIVETQNRDLIRVLNA